MKEQKEQAEYYRLCERAARLGIPVSLDDPRSVRTVAQLETQVRRALRV